MTCLHGGYKMVCTTCKGVEVVALIKLSSPQSSGVFCRCNKGALTLHVTLIKIRFSPRSLLREQLM